jgi:hypothetical protein
MNVEPDVNDSAAFIVSGPEGTGWFALNRC